MFCHALTAQLETPQLDRAGQLFELFAEHGLAELRVCSERVQLGALAGGKDECLVDAGAGGGTRRQPQGVRPRDLELLPRRDGTAALEHPYKDEAAEHRPLSAA